MVVFEPVTAVAQGLADVFCHHTWRHAQFDGDLRLGHAVDTAEQQRLAGIGRQLLQGVVEDADTFGGQQQAAMQQQQASPNILGDILGQEERQVRQQGGLGGGLLGAVLDQDGDGQLGIGDILKAGMGMMGGRR